MEVQRRLRKMEVDENDAARPAAKDRGVKRVAFGDNGNIAAKGIVKPRGLQLKTTRSSNAQNENVVAPITKKGRVTHVDEAEQNEVQRPSNGATSAECDLLTEDFVQEIKEYMLQLEERYAVDEMFLDGKAITSKMRCILVDWLVQVHQRFHLLAETLHLTVYLVDRYLEEHSPEKADLQLVGITAMLVACKYEETYCPDIKDFEYITDCAFTKKQILRMEMHMIKSSRFDLGRVHSISFLRSFTTALDVNPQVHCTAKYLAELTLMDSNFSALRSSLIAAGSVWLAAQLKAVPLNVNKAFGHLPISNAAQEVKRMGIRVAACAVRIKLLGKLKAVMDKYATVKAHHASQLSINEEALLEKIMKMDSH